MSSLDKKLRRHFKYTQPLYCDMGPFAGMWRLSRHMPIYLTSEELKELQGGEKDDEETALSSRNAGDGSDTTASIDTDS